jgi:hypothetical protein
MPVLTEIWNKRENGQKSVNLGVAGEIFGPFGQIVPKLKFARFSLFLNRPQILLPKVENKNFFRKLIFVLMFDKYIG